VTGKKNRVFEKIRLPRESKGLGHEALASRPDAYRLKVRSALDPTGKCNVVNICLLVPSLNSFQLCL
jgi:hypothetical protein